MARLKLLGLMTLIAGAGLGLGPAPAQAQARGADLGRPEVRGLDFRPDGAWRKRVRQIRERRRALLRTGSFAALNAPRAAARLAAPGQVTSDLAVSGTVNVPVIPIAYSNAPVAFPKDDYQQILFTPNPGALGQAYSLKTYFEELSQGLLTIEGTVFSPVRGDTTAAYYEDNCNGIGVLVSCPNGGVRFGSLLLAVLDSLSNRAGGDTVWSRFDNDGADGIPNSGDDDGVVDFVTFLHPTKDGSCQPSPGIWAHRWVIQVWNNGSAYVTKTPRRGAGGTPIPGQFLLVSDYIIQSGLGGLSGCDDTAIMPVGTVAHETGHVFGLPDLYDTDPTSGTEGIGEWGIMGSGNFARAYSPASYEAWSLAELGWVTLEELSLSRTITTGPRQVSDTVFVALTGPPGFHFLFENRQAVQSDTAQMNPFFTRAKAPGLLIWEVDEERLAIGLPGNVVNTTSRQGVSLMQADGLNQLRTRAIRNRGDLGDSYPGSTANTRFGFSTNPAARTNFGEYVGFIVDQIEPLPGQAMRFRFLRREPSRFAAEVAEATILVNGAAVNQLVDVIPPGDPVTLDVDTLQVTAEGRTRARFLTWSDGQPRSHTVISGAGPDTVTAAFTADHRLLVQTQGTGTVAASAPGDVAAGVFLTSGTAVTLTAAAPAGVVFAGWKGDTAAAGPMLQLTMQRPYDLVATFLQDLQIPLASATDDILGVAPLTADERTFLDAFGNRNGAFDLGDYLAFLRRQGVNPSVAASNAIAARRGRPEK